MSMSLEQRLDLITERMQSKFYGKYRGSVTDNADPTGRGRLKVRVPSVLGALDLWAMPCVPYAGAGVGFYSLPEPDTSVWVEFEMGDPSFPVWVGCFWADGELPADATGAPVKLWKTEKLTLRLDDDADEMLLLDTANSSVTLAADVKTESGGATHTVGSAGVVSEKGVKKVEVTSTAVVVNGGALEVT
jgi:uncharacterized protein involved in type VI secretion and phage assembly